MSRALLALLALPGCDRVFGVDFDNAPTLVTGTFTSDEVRNGPDLSPTHIAGQVEGLAMDVRFADGTSRTVEVSPDGTFTFETPDRSPYRLRMRTATFDVEIQQFAEQLTFVNARVGRSDFAPLDSTERVTISTTGVLAANDELWFNTTGVYSHGRLAPNLAQTFPFSRPQILPLFSSSLGRLDASAHDRAYLTVFRHFVDLTESRRVYLGLREIVDGPLTMTGGTTPFPGELQPAPPEEQLPCREVLPTARLEALRLAQLGRPYDSVSTRWAMKALIAPTTAPFASMLLAFTSDTAPDPSGIDDIATTVRIHNPYPNTEIAFEGTVSLEHLVQTGAGAPLSLPTTTVQLAPIGQDPACAAIGSIPTIGLPSTISFGGEPLATDDMRIAMPTDPTVALSWDMAVRGIGDLWSLTLHRIYVDNANQTVTEPVRIWNIPSGDERTFSVVVDSDAFTRNETYVFQLLHRSGNPNVDEGDYALFEYPAQVFVTWSGTFVVE